MKAETVRPQTAAVEIFGAGEIRNALISAGLAHCQDPFAVELNNKLDIDRRAAGVDVDVVVSVARGHLTEHATATAVQAKGDYRRRIADNFPSHFTAEAEMPESPGHFADARDIPQQRRDLRLAYNRETAESRSGLLGAIDADTFVAFDPTTQDDHLREGVMSAAIALQHDIREQVGAVAELLVAKKPGRFGRFLVRQSKHISSAPAEEGDSLHDAIAQLTELLSAARRAPSTLSRSVAEGLYDDVDREVAAVLRDRYDGLTRVAMELLRASVADAYELVVEQGQTHTSRKKRLSGAASSILVPATATLHGLDEQSNGVEAELDMGEFESPFPWLEGEMVRFSYVNGDSPFVFCTALSPNLRDISSRLRRQPKVAERFDALTERLKTFEASGNGSSSQHLKYFENATFYSLPIRYVSVGGSDPSRLYYTRTKIGKYPELAAGMEAYKDDTRLLILLGEVNKHTQLDLYQEMGVSRSVARAGNVGAT